MKSVVFVIVLIVAGVVGLGLYRGWFQFTSGSDGSKANITLSVDKDKFQKDKDKAMDKAQDIGQQAKDQTTATTQKTQN